MNQNIRLDNDKPTALIIVIKRIKGALITKFRLRGHFDTQFMITIEYKNELVIRSALKLILKIKQITSWKRK
jgi:hypothetical protein